MSEIANSRPQRPKTGGRQRGTPNVVTRDVRQAIATFAQGNVHRLQDWLEQIAEEDPVKAADLFVRILEYHVPKLARSEVDVCAHPPKLVRDMSLVELQALVAEEYTPKQARLTDRIE